MTEKKSPTTKKKEDQPKTTDVEAPVEVSLGVRVSQLEAKVDLLTKAIAIVANYTGTNNALTRVGFKELHVLSEKEIKGNKG